MSIRQFILSLIMYFPLLVAGQILNSGQYPIRIFGPADYEADQSILSVLEDDNGLLLLANTDGVLVFNGTKWELVTLDRNSRALWLTKDKSGRVFVAGEDEFGYLQLTNNRYVYHSLIPLLPDTLRGFGSIWEVESVSYGTYFRSSRYIFRYHEGGISVVSHKDIEGGTFDVLQSVNDTIYVRKREFGLGRIIANSFELIPHGASLRAVKINAILPLGNDLLVLTRLNGVLRFGKSGVKPFAENLTTTLGDAKIYHAASTNKLIAVATLTQGVYLINTSGELIAQINEQNYGINESVSCVYFDKQGALWIGTLNGVARVEIQDAIAVHASINNKDHTIYDLVRFQEDIYVGTHAGLFIVKNHDFRNAQMVQGVNSRMHFLSIMDGMLSATGYVGTCFIDSMGTQSVNTSTMHLYKLMDSIHYLGYGQEGLEVYQKKGKFVFKKIRKLPVPNNITHVYEHEPGKIWASSSSAGLTYYDLYSDSTRTFAELGATRIEAIQQNPHFISKMGVYKFMGDRLKKSAFIYKYIDSTQFNISDIKSDRNGNTIILYHDSQSRTLGMWLKKNATGYGRTLLPDLGLKRTDFVTTYLEDDGTLWLASNKQIFQIDLNKQFQLSGAFDVRITAARAGDASMDITEKNVSIAFNSNKLFFEFGSLHLSSFGTNSFQYRLVGLRDEWSAWAHHTSVSYPYLPPGRYRFEVRGINPNQVYSGISSFTFTILEPWYANRWAYLMYGFILTALVIGIVRLRSASLKRERNKLQQIVTERTQEIADKNKKLEALDKAKNHFYSNISHEFRTPLTLIIGPLEDFLETDEKPTKQAYKGLIKNAQRLLDLINQLLDLTKLEARQMPLELSTHKLGEYMKGVYSSFEGLSKHNDIEFHLQLSHKKDEVLFDQDKMDKILYNLLSNAFKFTPHGGRVIVRTSDDDTMYNVIVEDTGVGISSVHLPHIFDRFYQSHESTHATQPGTGIGLSLVRELVELHGGKLIVASTPNVGSTFVITVPRHPESNKISTYG